MQRRSFLGVLTGFVAAPLAWVKPNRSGSSISGYKVEGVGRGQARWQDVGFIDVLPQVPTLPDASMLPVGTCIMVGCVDNMWVVNERDGLPLRFWVPRG